ncbi:MAG: hypothetical protein U0350_46295 [Caldilineaceae bacterium]
MPNQKTTQQVEFGDFQTPPDLANQICAFLDAEGIRPVSVLEPTCGKGNLLLAATDRFGSMQKAMGLDINSEYIEALQQTVSTYPNPKRIVTITNDFFRVEWKNIFNQLIDPILIIGNPPWVTNTELATFNSQNLPQKSNFQQFSGLDAITGKSNFDISEWMLIHLLEQAKGHQATLAMLCKTSVARRVLTHAWKNLFQLGESKLYLIDAKKFFDVAVDACLLVCTLDDAPINSTCHIYTSLDRNTYQTTCGLIDKRLVADLNLFARWRHLRGESAYKWRSGIKHDCAKIMEFKRVSNVYQNGLGEQYPLEDQYLYPMLKSSDVANATHPTPHRWMLVTQAMVGADTQALQVTAPLTWRYLHAYSNFLDARKSAVYKKQPRFAIFGVGDYSFAPWKVAISSLYKKLHFAVVAPHAGKPVVFDDTCYFIACTTEAEAECLAALLNSPIANEFFNSLIFWDTKRPITVEILNQLDILALAQVLGKFEQFKLLTSAKSTANLEAQQLSLFA